MAQCDPSTSRKVFIEDYACEIYPNYGKTTMAKSASGGTKQSSNETTHHDDASEEFVGERGALKLADSNGNRAHNTASAASAWHQLPTNDAGSEKGAEEWGYDNYAHDTPHENDAFGASMNWKEAEEHHDETWSKSAEFQNHAPKNSTRQELPMDVPPSDEIHALLNRILSLEAQVEGHKEEIYYLRVEQQYMDSEQGNEHTDLYRSIEDHTNQINTLHSKIHSLHEKLEQEESVTRIGGRRMAD